MMKTACTIVGSTVTGICTTTANVKRDSGMATVTISPINATISGTLTTSNIIMANCSKSMWQSVVDRAVQTLHWVHLSRTSSLQLPLSVETEI
ncbi:hypothetical protein KIN20_028207 [Parelaphostrongylus tenuis]|uniref:Uncharacterized protein n=1 Tax=Parelaphostrongylus tenuis TaxID=148309 RepID=A0AAD5R0P8_PARTN|nr:hypothetical protein KIN20_028207 [Parelaphostrongylus tenuis]